MMPSSISCRPRLGCEALEDRLTPSGAGDLDPTFGTGGKEVLPLDSSFGTSASALTADQHILIAGSDANQFEVARLTQSGALDTAFGADGQAQIRFDDFGAGTTGHVSAVLAQPDGKILLIGSVSAPAANSNGPQQSVMALARLNADGTPDQTFGTGGKATVGLHLGTTIDLEHLSAAVLQSDGRIVAVGGATTGSGGMGEWLVVRFTPTGQLDTTFGTGGVKAPVVTPVNNSLSTANAVALTPDGRIVVAGRQDVSVPYMGGIGTTIQPTAEVVRLTPSGQLDSSFGADGKVILQATAAQGLAVQPDGFILVSELLIPSSPLPGVHTYPGDISSWIARLTPAGQPDTTFAGDGTAFLPFAGAPLLSIPPALGSSTLNILLPGDGKIVVAGTGDVALSPTKGSYQQEVARLNADGSLDKTFADQGVRQVAFGLSDANTDLVASSLLQADGNIVVVGLASAGGTAPNLTYKTTAFRLLGKLPPVTASTVLVGGPVDGTTQALPSGSAGLQLGAMTTPFPGFSGSVRTAVADVNGDGVPDSVVAAGPGGGPNVIVYDGTNGAKIADFFAFESSFTGGVFVAAADLNGDGKAEVIATPDQGGGPVVAIYDGTKLAAGQTADASQLARFLGIDDPAFRGGGRRRERRRHVGPARVRRLPRRPARRALRRHIRQR
jgi:uncharacterized delta-60 repeat protein